MNLKPLRLLLVISCVFGQSLTGFSQKPNVTAPTQSADNKQSDPAGSVFNLNQIHTIQLTITAENWEKMQPPQRGGGFGPPSGMRPVQIQGDPPPGGVVLIGPPPGGGPPQGGPQGGPPGRFGLEFEYVHGAVEVDGQSFKDAAVRFKGNASYMSSQRGLKRPFKIDLNKYEKNAQFKGLTTLVLNNNIMDASMMRETIAYPLFRAAGLPASRTGYAKVYLTVPGKHDREYLGLYTLVEFVDEDFLTRHFGNSDGLLLKPEGMQGGVQYLGENWDRYKERYDAKFGDKGEQGKKARQHLIQFAHLVNNGSDEEFNKKIGDYLEVDAFLRFLAVNVLTTNLDSILAMGHNYYFYLNPSTNKFVFFPWDLDLSFSGFPMGGSAEQQLDLSIDHPHTGTNKLIERLLAIEAVKKSYYNHLQSLLKTTFNPEQLEKQIATAEQLIREAVKAEPAQPSGPMGRLGGGRFGGSVSIREFIPRRIESVTAQLSGKSKGYVPQNRMRGGGPGGPGGFGPPGMAMVRPGTLEAPQLLKALDTDQNKSLSSAEFTTGAKQFFAVADKDKTGSLNNEELTNELDNLFSSVGLMAPSFIIARSVLRLADTNRDDQVSADEWGVALSNHFGAWDANKNTSLDEPELAGGLEKIMTQGIPRFEPINPPSSGEKPAIKK
ncbi:MAG: CotH kinase family protein [Blastocatellia bacterium]|nr:CotH kinase family protein [Blastocatellia bacterium]